MVNVILWVVQILLALFFLAVAIPKITGRGIEQWVDFSAVPRGLIFSIGFAEIVGALALVLPGATGVLPWLTPIAAIGLAVNVLMATGFHVRAAEWLNAISTTVWATIAAIIAVVRWNLVNQAAIAIDVRALAVALVVLVLAGIVVAIVFYSHAAPSGVPNGIAPRAADHHRST
jgi:DoxX-like family